MLKKGSSHINICSSDGVKTDVAEFNKFHRLLMDHPPEGYMPFYFKCDKEGKNPYMPAGKWLNAGLTYKEAITWLEEGGNIGIAGLNEDPLVIIDIDDETITDYKTLKPTLTARSGSRTGVHLFYFEDILGSIPNIPTYEAGEIRANNQYVIAPGSFVSGYEENIESIGKYTIESAINPSTIGLSDIPPVFMDQLAKTKNDTVIVRERKAKKTGVDSSALFSLSVYDIIAEVSDPQKRFPSIFHTSKTGENTSISSKGLIQCWRHLVSLNAQQALCVLSGFLTCEEAGEAHQTSMAGPSLYTENDEALFETWKSAKENGYIPIDDPIPSRALRYVAVSQNLCDEEDIADGWKLPREAYNGALEHLLSVNVQPGRVNLPMKLSEIVKKGEVPTSETKAKTKKNEDLIIATKASASITETLKTFRRWLYIEHDTDITIPLAYVLSNFSNTDPGCMAIIAPSGSYKTELIRSFGEEENDLIYPLDNLTSHTLISGLPKVPDVIPDLQRRLITIKDFTALLSKREEERTAIFSDIREMLDGYMSRSFGSGKRVTYRDIHSSLLIASTNAIEGFYSLNATLGQRMIFFRPSNDPTKARERALENMNHTDQMREELQTSVKRLLSHLVTGNHRLERIGENLSKEEKESLGAYTDFVAIARTHVKRDYKGYIAEIPEPEFPTRLFKEVVKIIECHAILFNREVCQDDLQAGVVILHHNVPRERFKLIRKLAEESIRGFHTSELATSLSLSSYMAKQRLDELLMLKLIYRESFRGGNKGDKWRIVPRYRSVVQHFLDFETDLAVGGNMGRGIHIIRHCFISDLNFRLDQHTNNINSNKESITKDKGDSYLIRPVYTTTNLPPPLECQICKKSTPYLSYYLEKAYCDHCLEDELNKINGFGKNTVITEFEGERLCEDAIKSYSPVEKGICERCDKERFLDHEWIDGEENHLICSGCAEELKNEETKEEDEVPEVIPGISKNEEEEDSNYRNLKDETTKVPEGISKDKDIEYVNMGGGKQ